MLRAPKRGRYTGRALRAAAAAVVCTLLGLGMSVWLLVLPWWYTRAAGDWTRTTCHVEESRVEVTRDSDGDRNEDLVLRYRYEAGGHTYIGTRFDFAADENARDAVAAAPTGADVPCFFDPADPSRAVLVRRSGTNPFAYIVLLFVFGGPIALVQALRHGRRGGAATARADGQLRVDRTTTLMMAISYLVGGAGLFASMLGFDAPRAILALLVLVGVGLGVAGLRELARYITGASIVLEPAVARLGETARLRYRIRRAPFGVRHGTLSLIARERAVVGGDSSDELRRVHVKVVAELDVPEGTAEVTLPAEMMPSFTAADFELEWRLRLEVDLPFWPDLALDFELDLDAHAAAADEPADELAPPIDGPARLLVDRDQVAPGERIVAHVGWHREQAPSSAEVRLRWHVKGKRKPESSVEAEATVASLPRPPSPDQSDQPYRGHAGGGAAAPLAARELRRFVFGAPSRPLTYRGALFEVDWTLELVIDGSVVATCPLVIGPGRNPIVVTSTEEPKHWWQQTIGKYF